MEPKEVREEGQNERIQTILKMEKTGPREKNMEPKNNKPRLQQKSIIYR